MSAAYKILNLNELKKILVFANTPTYLFNHYRSDSSVQQFSKESVLTLTRVFNLKAGQNLSTLNNLAVIYACVVAISFKEEKEMLNFFRHINKSSKIQWRDELVKICASKIRITDRHTYDFTDPSNLISLDNKQVFHATNSYAINGDENG